MSIANWLFKKKVKELATTVIDGEDAIDSAVDKFLSKINWGMIVGFIARKIIGKFK